MDIAYNSIYFPLYTYNMYIIKKEREEENILTTIPNLVQGEAC